MPQGAAPAKYIPAGRGGSTKLNPAYTVWKQEQDAAIATQNANVAAQNAKIQAAEAAIGGRPSWAPIGKFTASVDANGNLTYGTIAGDAYYDSSGHFLHGSQTGFDFNPIPILAAAGLAVILPGVGSAIASYLLEAGVVTSTAVANLMGSAIASTAVSVAQGQPLDKALTNAIVSAAISTGSVEAAKEVNTFVGQPAVTDAIVSAAGSAVKTIAAGGTEADITQNMIGSLAGSAASSAYNTASDNVTNTTGRVIGSSIAGAVTGGTLGALTGAAGELGNQQRGAVSGAIEDVISPIDSGGGSDATSVTSEQLSGAGDVTPPGLEGPPAPAPELTPTPVPTPAPEPILQPTPAPTATAGTPPPPLAASQDQAILDLINTPESVQELVSLPPVEITAQKPVDVIDTNIISPTSDTPAPITSTPVPEPVVASVTPTPTELAPVEITATRPTDITDTNIIDESVPVSQQPSPDQAILDLLNPPAPDIELPPVTVTGQRPKDITSTDIIDAPVTLDPVTVTAKRDSILDPVTVTGKQDITDTDIIDEPATIDEPKPKDKPYNPNLFILGKVAPKTTTPSTSALSQALGTTTGLASSRGAGEIEDPSTGKKRRNVWNEESLRLKDALGI
jgi:hypothetical protein